MWAWICIAIFLLLGVLVAITPVQLSAYYGRVGENDHVVVEVSAWFRLIRRKYEIPVLALDMLKQGPEVVAKVETVKQGKQTKESVRDITRRQIKKWYDLYHELLELVRDLRPVVQDFCKKVRCTRLEWHTAMGTGQADETGALTGMIWGMKSMIVGVFTHTISLRTMPRLSVQAVWNQSLLRTQLQLNLRFYLGHVLLAGLKVLYRLWQGKIIRKWHAAPTEA